MQSDLGETVHTAAAYCQHSSPCTWEQLHSITHGCVCLETLQLLASLCCYDLEFCFLFSAVFCNAHRRGCAITDTLHDAQVSWNVVNYWIIVRQVKFDRGCNRWLFLGCDATLLWPRLKNPPCDTTTVFQVFQPLLCTFHSSTCNLTEPLLLHNNTLWTLVGHMQPK